MATALALVLAFVATGAAARGAAEPPPTPAQIGGLYPLEVFDGLGDRLIIRAAPRRIVSLSLMTDEILLELVGPSRLLAVTSLADDPGISNIAGRVASIPHRLTLNAEKLLALAPDLVFAASWSDADVVRQVREAGIAVYRVASPRSIEAVRATIAEIGRVVGEQRRAEAVIAEMDRRLAAVASRVGRVPQEARLRVLDYDPSGFAFGRGSSWDDIVERAGLVSAARELASDAWGNVPLSQEQLLKLDPDILVLSGWRYGDPQGARRAYERLLSDPAFRGLKAVKSGRVMLADERHRLATSQYVVAAVEELASFAYPELFR